MKSSRVHRFLAVITVFVLLIGGLNLWRQLPGLKNRAANRRLIQAILHNDTAEVKEALKAGADPNVEMEGMAWTDFVHPLTNALMGDMNLHLRDTPLLLTMDCLVKRDAKAVRKANDSIPLENLETVKALVEAGADVNARNRIGDTPLEMAVTWGYSATAHYLLEHKANPNIADVAGMTPCHFAASHEDTKLMKDLLDHGVNPNAKNIGGETPLFDAVLPTETPQQVEIVKLLLQYHADPTIKDEKGLTALDHSQQDHRPGIIKILLQQGSQTPVPSP